MTARGRRRLRVGLLAVAVAAGLHTAVWFWAMTMMTDGVAALLAGAPAPGMQFHAGPLRRGGWPLAVRVELPEVVVAVESPDLPQGLLWQADRVVAEVALLRPRRLLIDAAGHQRLVVGAGPVVPVQVERFAVVVPLDPGVPPRRAEFSVGGLRAKLPAGILTLADVDGHASFQPAATEGETAATLVLAALGIGLPWAISGPLGAEVERLDLAATLTGPVPREADPLRRAAAWRDGGGVLEIQRLHLAWGALQLEGGATLALDGDLQPMGAGTARLTGHAAAVDALAAAGALPPFAAATAKAFLAGLARRDPAGGAARVDVPFSLQQRTLALGRLPLARLPPLPWTGPR